MKILMYACMLRWVFFHECHDEVACLHVERYMVVGVGLFSCILCDDVACLHVKINMLVEINLLGI